MKGNVHPLLRRVRRVAAMGADSKDGDLLRRFVERRDEAAFEAFLLRHGPVVRAVCRRVLQTVRLWHIAAGKELCHFFGQLDNVDCVAFSPDGRYALPGGGASDKTVRLRRLPK